MTSEIEPGLEECDSGRGLNRHSADANDAFSSDRNKFVEFDMKPVCKKCYEKFPLELKKRLKKLAESLGRK